MYWFSITWLGKIDYFMFVLSFMLFIKIADNQMSPKYLITVISIKFTLHKPFMLK